MATVHVCCRRPGGRVRENDDVSQRVTRRDGTVKIAASITASDKQLVSATVGAAKQETYALTMYRCDQPVDARTLLCTDTSKGSNGRHEYRPWQGAVATATLSPERTSLRLHTVVDSVDASQEIEHVLISPDGEQVLVQTTDGWFRGPADGSAEPKAAFDALPSDSSSSADTTIVGWV